MKNYLILVASMLSGFAASFCKSTSPGSIAQSVNPDAGPIVPKVDRLFWADGIEQVLPPAKAAELPPLAHHMSGLWYLHGPASKPGSPGLSTGAVLLTLAGAKVLPNGHLLIGSSQPLMYAMNYPYAKDMFVNTVNFYEYEMIFHDDKSGELIFQHPEIADRGGEDDKYDWFTFKFKAGEWTRQTMDNGQMRDDYTMTQIVDENGNRTRGYDLYLEHIGKGLRFCVTVAQDSRYGHGSIVPGPGKPAGAADTSTSSTDATTSKATRDSADDQTGATTSEKTGSVDAKAKEATGKR